MLVCRPGCCKLWCTYKKYILKPAANVQCHLSGSCPKLGLQKRGLISRYSGYGSGVKTMDDYCASISTLTFVPVTMVKMMVMK